MKIKETLLAISIMILTIFVTFYGINTLLPKPQYDYFCKGFTNLPMKAREVCPTVCVSVYELNNNECVYIECGSGCGADNISTFNTLEDCEAKFGKANCYDQLEDAQESRSRYVFFIALPLGIIIVLLGTYLFGLEVVGAGLIGGGVATLIYGGGAFWPYTENWVRFLLSLLGLVILIWLIYYFTNKGKRKK
ncbi:MAG: hypothetical protein ABIH59_03350 [archaeon]